VSVDMSLVFNAASRLEGIASRLVRASQPEQRLPADKNLPQAATARVIRLLVSTNRFLGCGCAAFRDVLVLLRCVSTDADRTYDLSVDNDGNPSLQRRSARENQ
jgi:hypothetical protein